MAQRQDAANLAFRSANHHHNPKSSQFPANQALLSTGSYPGGYGSLQSLDSNTYKPASVLRQRTVASMILCPGRSAQIIMAACKDRIQALPTRSTRVA
jgi:hypothetical protein